jgi:hypothetical protein
MKVFIKLIALSVIAGFVLTSCSVQRTASTGSFPVTFHSEQVKTAELYGYGNINFPYQINIDPNKKIQYFLFAAQGYNVYTLQIRRGEAQPSYNIIFTENPRQMARLRAAQADVAARAVDPTIREGEAQSMVTRDAPGQTSLERTIIRWNFDSEPRGARIFWRVISSIPDQVKNTNELYLTTSPYEETRSFNILGLTYENSRDVVIEVKMTAPGYADQVKRYNVRQAIDQQEISGFFDLVKKLTE